LNRFRLAALGAIMILLMGGGAAAAPLQAAQSAGAEWDARRIDGEVYVKASSLIAALGGTGTFDEKRGKFSYTPTNRIADVVKQVSPSVVGIIGKAQGGGYSASGDDRFNLIHGTGVIVKKDGWIITNAHVIKDMKEIFVVTADGKEYKGTSPYKDEESDLALVKVAAADLPVAKLAERLEQEVGETVIAIGTPISFALRNSVTVGVISGVDRSIHSTYRLLQTDAAINPGNSGGALVNMNGEVIGINSLKFAAVGVDSLGFAIPIDTVHYVMNQLFKNGKVIRPSLGLELEESWASLVGLPAREPLSVTGVRRGSPAEKAGIRPGDVLYSLNGTNLSSLVDLNELLKAYQPGDQAKLALKSGGDLKIMTLKLIEE